MTVHPTGTCFEDVTMGFAEKIREDKRRILGGFYMVHGICLFPDGRKYSHAWIEVGEESAWFPGIVDGEKVFLEAPLEEFRKLFRVQEFTRYDFKALLEVGKRVGNVPPPWEEKYLKLCRDYKP